MKIFKSLLLIPLLFILNLSFSCALAANGDPHVQYAVHVENIGWQDPVMDGKTAGTTGSSLRQEAIKVSVLDDNNQPYDGLGVEYRSHVQDEGWNNYVTTGETSGTTGQAKKVEAVQIKLNGSKARNYKIAYRTHVQDYGWTGWTTDGKPSGSEGYNKRLEAIEIKIVPASENVSSDGTTIYSRYGDGDVRYSAHVQDIGWQDFVQDGKTAGTTGQNKRLESLIICPNPNLPEGEILTSAHIEDIGWKDYQPSYLSVGTVGQGKRLEAIKFKLTGKLAQQYDIEYRAHVQDIGWQEPVKNDEVAGTTGECKKIEAIEVNLIKKGPVVSDKVRIDRDQFIEDPSSQTYTLNSSLSTLKGTMSDSKSVKSAHYKVENVKNSVVKEGDITPSDNWTISDFGLVVGPNTITVEAEYPDGTEIDTVKVVNTEPANMERLDIDLSDSDGDGLNNYLESYYNSDPNKEDTDGDGLNDYLEALELSLDPTKVDTDNNNVKDPDEDTDKDGLTNIEEVKGGTLPYQADTDNDELNDSQERNYKTDPHNVDTDGDTLTDGYEVLHGLNPLVPDTDSDSVNDDIEVKIGTDPTTPQTENDNEVIRDVNGNNATIEFKSGSYAIQYLDDTVEPSVTITGDVDNLKTLSVSPVTEIQISESIPGALGAPYNFDLDDPTGFNKATITMRYDPSVITDPNNFEPVIYYYDEENDRLEELKCTVDLATNTVSTDVSHFSTYVLLNKRDFNEVWEEIKNNSINDVPQVPSNPGVHTNVSVSFVVDGSGSMSDNDRNGVRKDVIKQFLDKLDFAHDKASVIQFESSVTMNTGLTNNYDELVSSLSGLHAGGGTTGYSGLTAAFEQLNSDDNRNTSFIIYLTDGEDSSISSYQRDIINKALDSNIKIYSVGLGSANERDLKAIAEGTGGRYYHATQAIELPEIYEDVTHDVVDYSTDSNNDGLSDYYTKKLCEGNILTTTGTPTEFIMYSYDEIQNNPDVDGDGLLNGDEVRIKRVDYLENEDGVYEPVAVVSFISDPFSVNGDMDAYDDSVEFDMNTDPLTYNVSIGAPAIDSVVGDEAVASFASHQANSDFEEHNSKQITTYLENGVWGGKWDMVQLSKSAFMDYFDLLSHRDDKDALKDIASIGSKIFTQSKTAMIELASLGLNDYAKDIQSALKTADNSDDVMNILGRMGDSFKNVEQKGHVLKNSELNLGSTKLGSKLKNFGLNNAKGLDIASKIGTGLKYATITREKIEELVQFNYDITVIQNQRDLLEEIGNKNQDVSITASAKEILLMADNEAVRLGVIIAEAAEQIGIEKAGDSIVAAIAKANPQIGAAIYFAKICKSIINSLGIIPNSKDGEAAYKMHVLASASVNGKDKFKEDYKKYRHKQSNIEAEVYELPFDVHVEFLNDWYGITYMREEAEEKCKETNELRALGFINGQDWAAFFGNMFRGDDEGKILTADEVVAKCNNSISALQNLRSPDNLIV